MTQRMNNVNYAELKATIKVNFYNHYVLCSAEELPVKITEKMYRIFSGYLNAVKFTTFVSNVRAFCKQSNTELTAFVCYGSLFDLSFNGSDFHINVKYEKETKTFAYNYIQHKKE
jgi:hypothetical protein